METLTKSPGFTSTCPASLRNSSTAMMLSDFSPAFTTTKFSSTLTTSAVITSPTRISLRLRLSSKRAANDSPAGWDGAGEMLDIRGKTFQTAGLEAGRAKLNTGRSSAPPTQNSLLVQIQNLFTYLLDRKCRRIEYLRIGRWDQGRDRAACVARVPFLKVPGKGAKISMDSFVYQLLISPFGPYFRARCQEHLECRVGEHHGAHVAAVGHQPGGLAVGPLPLQQRLAHERQLRHLGGAIAARLGSYRVADVFVFKQHFVFQERNIHVGSDFRERDFVLHAPAQRSERDQPVERAAFQVMKAERVGDVPRDRPLARGGRAVDGDHGHVHETIFLKKLKNSGNVLATHWGSLIVTGTPPSATSEKLIAMRWSS